MRAAAASAMPVAIRSVPDLNQKDKEAAAWENLCQRCGLCCFEKGIDGTGRIIETQVPCRHLDIHTRLCRVYNNRQQVEFDCIKLTSEKVAELKWLPESCAYRQQLIDSHHRKGSITTS